MGPDQVHGPDGCAHERQQRERVRDGERTRRRLDLVAVGDPDAEQLYRPQRFVEVPRIGGRRDVACHLQRAADVHPCGPGGDQHRQQSDGGARGRAPGLHCPSGDRDEKDRTEYRRAAERPRPERRAQRGGTRRDDKPDRDGAAGSGPEPLPVVGDERTGGEDHAHGRDLLHRPDQLVAVYKRRDDARERSQRRRGAPEAHAPGDQPGGTRRAREHECV